MKNHDWTIAIHGLGLILNRGFWEGDAQSQTYSFDGILGVAVASGLPKNNPEATQYLLDNLREWETAGFITVANKNGLVSITIINPAFPFLNLYG